MKGPTDVRNKVLATGGTGVVERVTVANGPQPVAVHTLSASLHAWTAEARKKRPKALPGRAFGARTSACCCLWDLSKIAFAKLVRLLAFLGCLGNLTATNASVVRIANFGEY